MILKIVKKVDKQIEIKKLYNFLNNFIVTALISPLFLMTSLTIIDLEKVLIIDWVFLLSSFTLFVIDDMFLKL